MREENTSTTCCFYARFSPQLILVQIMETKKQCLTFFSFYDATLHPSIKLRHLWTQLLFHLLFRRRHLRTTMRQRLHLLAPPQLAAVGPAPCAPALNLVCRRK